MLTNADQFALRGDPWVTRRERPECSGAGRIPRPYDPDYRDPRKPAPVETPEMAKSRRQREAFMDLKRRAKAGRGEIVRECLDYERFRPDELVVTHVHPRDRGFGEAPKRQLTREELACARAIEALLDWVVGV